MPGPFFFLRKKTMIRVHEVRRREEVTVNKPNPQAVGLYR